jgi:SAM-dependent methyltransferase
VVADLTGDTKLQSEVLEDLSDAFRYRRWLAGMALPYLGDDPLEVGSGLGHYALEWLPSVRRFTATEADPARLVALKERLGNQPNVTVRELMLPAEDNGTHSAVVAFNVLEHIPDHVGALRGMAGLMRPGGKVVLLVPAFPSAMSRFDREIGHVQRYTRASLGAALTEAGLKIEVLHYVNPIGLLSWYVMVKGLRMTPRNGVMLRVYDRLVVPVARWMERRGGAPFGQSVFAIASTPGSDPNA